MEEEHPEDRRRIWQRDGGNQELKNKVNKAEQNIDTAKEEAETVQHSGWRRTKVQTSSQWRDQVHVVQAGSPNMLFVVIIISQG